MNITHRKKSIVSEFHRNRSQLLQKIHKIKSQCATYESHQTLTSVMRMASFWQGAECQYAIFMLEDATDLASRLFNTSCNFLEDSKCYFATSWVLQTVTSVM